MKERILLSVLILIFAFTLQAKDSNMQSAFIEEIVGARAWGLGGAYRTLVNNPGALIWNPAGLSGIKEKHSFSLEHTELTEFYSYSFFGYAYRLDEKRTFGCGILYSGDDVMSELTGYLSAGLDASVIGDVLFKGVLPDNFLKIGMSGKVFYSSYGNNNLELGLPPEIYANQVSGSAFGLGLDLGTRLKLTPKDHFSMTFKNLLNRVRWESENDAGTALGGYNETLPVNWTLGYARHQNRVIFAVDLHKSLYYDEEDNLHLGLEYLLSRELTLRAGYAQELVTADSQRFAVGAGINVDLPVIPTIRIDLTYLMNLDWEGYNSLLFALSI